MTDMSSYVGYDVDAARAAQRVREYHKSKARMNVPRKRYVIELEVPLRAGVTVDNLLGTLRKAMGDVPHQAQVVSTTVLNADGSVKEAK
jgi:hypothetical protein